MKKSSEEIVSMFLGLVVVVAVVGLVFSYFQRRKGNVEIPGTSQTLTKPDEGENVSNKREYTVKKGDNLWKIAEETYGSGYNWVDIQKANEIKNPGLLAVGQKIVLPEQVSAMEVTAEKGGDEIKTSKIESENYQVVRNDNLWKIAVRAYGDGYQWTKIWENNRNKLNDPDKLEIGMILTLPAIR